MKKSKYKGQNEKKYKKILIVLFVVTFILFLSLIIALNAVKNYENKKSELTYDMLTTLKEVIEYHGSKYISQQSSSKFGFYIEVYLKFKVLPYSDSTSNEKYYTTLIDDCAKIINYSSFILKDEQNELTIQVICDGSKVEKIIINDIEDYFIYMDSQISMQEYKEIKIAEIKIESEELQRCIENDWDLNTDLGVRDSIFEDYYIYFDEGIKARFIDGKIYNIVFTKKYSKNVINGLFVGIDFNTIQASMGEPTFEDEEKSIIGYKGEKVYTFFTEDEISVYRNNQIETDDFFKLADKFLADEMNLLEFMNELTYMWPDYSEYSYDATSVFITYPLKGVEIRINSGDINGILLYNNIKSSLSKINRYLEDTTFVARLQLDLVFEAEKRRLEEKVELLEEVNEYNENLDEKNRKLIGNSMNYEILPVKDNGGNIYSIKFISKYEERPNRELNDGVTSFLWLTSEYFLYSKNGKGIYFYNLDTGKVIRIITGTEEYVFKSYEDKHLKYDDTEIILDF